MESLLQNDEQTFLALTGAIIKIAINLSMNLWRNRKIPASHIIRMLIPLRNALNRAIEEIQTASLDESIHFRRHSPVANSTMVRRTAPNNQRGLRANTAPTTTQSNEAEFRRAEQEFDQKYCVSKSVFKNNPDGTTVNITKTISGPDLTVIKDGRSGYRFVDSTFGNSTSIGNNERTNWPQRLGNYHIPH